MAWTYKKGVTVNRWNSEQLHLIIYSAERAVRDCIEHQDVLTASRYEQLADCLRSVAEDISRGMSSTGREPRNDE